MNDKTANSTVTAFMQMKGCWPDGLDAGIEIVDGPESVLAQVDGQVSTFQVLGHDAPRVFSRRVQRHGHHFGDGRVAQHRQAAHLSQRIGLAVTAADQAHDDQFTICWHHRAEFGQAFNFTEMDL